MLKIFPGELLFGELAVNDAPSYSRFRVENADPSFSLKLQFTSTCGSAIRFQLWDEMLFDNEDSSTDLVITQKSTGEQNTDGGVSLTNNANAYTNTNSNTNTSGNHASNSNTGSAKRVAGPRFFTYNAVFDSINLIDSLTLEPLESKEIVAVFHADPMQFSNVTLQAPPSVVNGSICLTATSLPQMHPLSTSSSFNLPVSFQRNESFSDTFTNTDFENTASMDESVLALLSRRENTGEVGNVSVADNAQKTRTGKVNGSFSITREPLSLHLTPLVSGMRSETVTLPFSATVFLSFLTVSKTELNVTIAPNKTQLLDFTVTNVSSRPLPFVIRTQTMPQKNMELALYEGEKFEDPKIGRSLLLDSFASMNLSLMVRTAGIASRHYRSVLQCDNLRDARNSVLIYVNVCVTAESQTDLVSVTESTIDFGAVYRGTRALREVVFNNTSRQDATVRLVESRPRYCEGFLTLARLTGGSSNTKNTSNNNTNTNTNTSKAGSSDNNDDEAPTKGVIVPVDEVVISAQKNQVPITIIYVPSTDQGHKDTSTLNFELEFIVTGTVTDVVGVGVGSAVGVGSGSGGGGGGGGGGNGNDSGSRRRQQRVMVRCVASLFTSTIVASQTDINFGDCQVGQSKRYTFSIENPSPLPTIIYVQLRSKVISVEGIQPRVSATGGRETVEEFSVAPQSSLPLTLRITPQRVNPTYRKQLTIVNASNPADDRLIVNIEANNMAPSEAKLHNALYTCVCKIEGGDSTGTDILGLRAITNVPLIVPYTIQSCVDHTLTLHLTTSSVEIEPFALPNLPECCKEVEELESLAGELNRCCRYGGDDDGPLPLAERAEELRDRLMSLLRHHSAPVLEGNFTLEPREVRTLYVQIKRLTGSGSESATKEDGLSIAVEGVEVPRFVRLSYRLCASRFELSGQKTKNFGEVNIGERKTTKLPIVNQCNSLLLMRISKSRSVTAGHIRIENSDRNSIYCRVRPYARKEVELTFYPGIKGGFEERIRLTNVLDPSNEVTMTLKATVTKGETFDVSPDSWSFGLVSVPMLLTQQTQAQQSQLTTSSTSSAIQVSSTASNREKKMILPSARVGARFTVSNTSNTRRVLRLKLDTPISINSSFSNINNLNSNTTNTGNALGTSDIPAYDRFFKFEGVDVRLQLEMEHGGSSSGSSRKLEEKIEKLEQKLKIHKRKNKTQKIEATTRQIEALKRALMGEEVDLNAPNVVSGTHTNAKSTETAGDTKDPALDNSTATVVSAASGNVAGTTPSLPGATTMTAAATVAGATNATTSNATTAIPTTTSGCTASTATTSTNVPPTGQGGVKGNLNKGSSNTAAGSGDATTTTTTTTTTNNKSSGSGTCSSSNNNDNNPSTSAAPESNNASSSNLASTSMSSSVEHRQYYELSDSDDESAQASKPRARMLQHADLFPLLFRDGIVLPELNSGESVILTLGLTCTRTAECIPAAQSGTVTFLLYEAKDTEASRVIPVDITLVRMEGETEPAATMMTPAVVNSNSVDTNALVNSFASTGKASATTTTTTTTTTTSPPVARASSRTGRNATSVVSMDKSLTATGSGNDTATDTPNLTNTQQQQQQAQQLNAPSSVSAVPQLQAVISLEPGEGTVVGSFMRYPMVYLHNTVAGEPSEFTITVRTTLDTAVVILEPIRCCAVSKSALDARFKFSPRNGAVHAAEPLHITVECTPTSAGPQRYFIPIKNLTHATDVKYMAVEINPTTEEELLQVSPRELRLSNIVTPCSKHQLEVQSFILTSRLTTQHAFLIRSTRPSQLELFEDVKCSIPLANPVYRTFMHEKVRVYVRFRPSERARRHRARVMTAGVRIEAIAAPVSTSTTMLDANMEHYVVLAQTNVRISVRVGSGELVVPNPVIDLGTVPSSDRIARTTLRIKNPSDTFMIRAKLVPSLSLTLVEARDFSLAPREELEVPVTLQLNTPGLVREHLALYNLTCRQDSLTIGLSVLRLDEAISATLNDGGCGEEVELPTAAVIIEEGVPRLYAPVMSTKLHVTNHTTRDLILVAKSNLSLVMGLPRPSSPLVQLEDSVCMTTTGATAAPTITNSHTANNTAFSSMMASSTNANATTSPVSLVGGTMGGTPVTASTTGNVYPRGRVRLEARHTEAVTWTLTSAPTFNRENIARLLQNEVVKLETTAQIYVAQIVEEMGFSYSSLFSIKRTLPTVGQCVLLPKLRMSFAVSEGRVEPAQVNLGVVGIVTNTDDCTDMRGERECYTFTENNSNNNSINNNTSTNTAPDITCSTAGAAMTRTSSTLLTYGDEESQQQQQQSRVPRVRHWITGDTVNRNSASATIRLTNLSPVLPLRVSIECEPTVRFSSNRLVVDPLQTITVEASLVLKLIRTQGQFRYAVFFVNELNPENDMVVYFTGQYYWKVFELTCDGATHDVRESLSMDPLRVEETANTAILSESKIVVTATESSHVEVDLCATMNPKLEGLIELQSLRYDAAAPLTKITFGRQSGATQSSSAAAVTGGGGGGATTTANNPGTTLMGVSGIVSPSAAGTVNSGLSSNTNIMNNNNNNTLHHNSGGSNLVGLLVQNSGNINNLNNNNPNNGTSTSSNTNSGVISGNNGTNANGAGALLATVSGGSNETATGNNSSSGAGAGSGGNGNHSNDVNGGATSPHSAPRPREQQSLRLRCFLRRADFAALAAAFFGPPRRYRNSAELRRERESLTFDKLAEWERRRVTASPVMWLGALRFSNALTGDEEIQVFSTLAAFQTFSVAQRLVLRPVVSSTPTSVSTDLNVGKSPLNSSFALSFVYVGELVITNNCMEHRVELSLTTITDRANHDGMALRCCPLEEESNSSSSAAAATASVPTSTLTERTRQDQSDGLSKSLMRRGSLTTLLTAEAEENPSPAFSDTETDVRTILFSIPPQGKRRVQVSLRADPRRHRSSAEQAVALALLDEMVPCSAAVVRLTLAPNDEIGEGTNNYLHPPRHHHHLSPHSLDVTQRQMLLPITSANMGNASPTLRRTPSFSDAPDATVASLCTLNPSSFHVRPQCVFAPRVLSLHGNCTPVVGSPGAYACSFSFAKDSPPTTDITIRNNLIDTVVEYSVVIVSQGPQPWLLLPNASAVLEPGESQPLRLSLLSTQAGSFVGYLSIFNTITPGEVMLLRLNAEVFVPTAGEGLFEILTSNGQRMSSNAEKRVFLGRLFGEDSHRAYVTMEILNRSTVPLEFPMSVVKPFRMEFTNSSSDDVEENTLEETEAATRSDTGLPVCSGENQKGEEESGGKKTPMNDVILVDEGRSELESTPNNASHTIFRGQLVAANCTPVSFNSSGNKNSNNTNVATNAATHSRNNNHNNNNNNNTNSNATNTGSNSVIRPQCEVRLLVCHLQNVPSQRGQQTFVVDPRSRVKVAFLLACDRLALLSGSCAKGEAEVVVKCKQARDARFVFHTFFEVYRPSLEVPRQTFFSPVNEYEVHIPVTNLRSRELRVAFRTTSPVLDVKVNRQDSTDSLLMQLNQQHQQQQHQSLQELNTSAVVSVPPFSVSTFIVRLATSRLASLLNLSSGDLSMTIPLLCEHCFLFNERDPCERVRVDLWHLPQCDIRGKEVSSFPGTTGPGATSLLSSPISSGGTAPALTRPLKVGGQHISEHFIFQFVQRFWSVLSTASEGLLPEFYRYSAQGGPLLFSSSVADQSQQMLSPSSQLAPAPSATSASQSQAQTPQQQKQMQKQILTEEDRKSTGYETAAMHASPSSSFTCCWAPLHALLVDLGWLVDELLFMSILLRNSRAIEAYGVFLTAAVSSHPLMRAWRQHKACLPSTKIFNIFGQYLETLDALPCPTPSLN